MTLLVKNWRCALFLHPDNGRVWFVMSIAHGKWDWESSNEIEIRSDVYDASNEIGILLHRIEAVLTAGNRE